MNIRQRNIIIAAITIVAILGMPTRNTFAKKSKVKTIKVTLLSANKCQIKNNIIPISKISKGIKSAGGNKKSHISITVPKDVNYNSVKKIINALAKGGYMKIHLQKPREAIAYVNEKKKK